MAWNLLPANESNNISDMKNIKFSRKYHALELNNAIYIPFTTWQDLVKKDDLFVISSGGISLESNTLNKSLFSSSSFPPQTWIWMKIDNSSNKGKKKLLRRKKN